MKLGILERVRRHAAVASGNFASMLKGADLAPLPAATARLIAEINQPDPDTARLVKVISASPQLSAKVLRTVNSSRFALANRVTTVRHAFALLGLRHIRAIALSYAMVDAVPKPKDTLFDQEAFWADSLLRALLARAFARKQDAGDREEEAFTAMLLADVALPVLLSTWAEYYAPVVERWGAAPERLSQVEREVFKWDHAQAAAWLLQSWGFPDEIVCFVGVHNLSCGEIQELGLGGTIALPMAIASLAPSMLKPCPERARLLTRTARETLSIAEQDLRDLLAGVQADLGETRALFDLKGRDSSKVLEDLQSFADPEGLAASEGLTNPEGNEEHP